MFGNNRQHTRDTLYQLKYRYGRLVYVRHPVSESADVTTGKTLRVFDVTTVRRAIVMPAEKARTAIYDLTYIASNKNFGYGGFFEENNTVVLFDYRDLKTPPTSVDHLVIDNRRYEIVKTTTFEGNSMVAAKMVEPSTPILDVNGD